MLSTQTQKKPQPPHFNLLNSCINVAKHVKQKKKVVTYLPVPFFGFIIKLMQHKEVNNIWHIVVPS